jgi:hypothetical protein
VTPKMAPAPNIRRADHHRTSLREFIPDHASAFDHDRELTSGEDRIDVGEFLHRRILRAFFSYFFAVQGMIETTKMFFGSKPCFSAK